MAHRRTAEAAAFCFAGLLLTLAWTFHAGKDLSFDVANHHLYLPFSLLSGRYATDLFAAGPQSYQNPLGYLPGYWLVVTGAPSWLVAIGLAALHAIPTAWALHRITLSVFGNQPDGLRWRGLAMAAAWCAPIFLLLAGTTSIDPLGASLTLIAVATAVERQPKTCTLIAGGVALGLAVAIKPTSIVFAMALVPVLLLRTLVGQVRWSQAFGATIAVITGLGLGLGQWSAWLWRAFRNPVFPLFNDVFQSPYAPQGAAVSGRFVVHTPWDMIERLWQMAAFRSFTMTEAFVPDFRPLLAAILLLFAVARLLAGRSSVRSASEVAGRADVQLFILLVTAYPIWLISSGNARYVIAWFMLLGIGMMRALQVAIPGRVAPILAAVLVLVQSIIYIGYGNLRFIAEPWDDQPFISATVAPRLVHEPILHLSIGVQTFAVAALLLNRTGALINVSGQMTLPTDGPLGDRLKEKLQQWKGRTRFLMPLPPTLEDNNSDRSNLEKARYVTYPLGLEIDWADCERIQFHGASRPSAPHGQALTSAGADSVRLVSCGARKTAGRDPVIDDRIRQADQIFKLIEEACPEIYGPPPFVSDVGPAFIQRLYVNSDARVSVSSTEGVLITHFRAMTPVTLGTIDHVVATRGAEACNAWSKLNRQ
jgi:hypothetical protein